MSKSIQTNFYYGSDPSLLYVLNSGLGDARPDLLGGYFAVYENWYVHEQKVLDGSSTFLFDSTLPLAERHWRRERFGNYLFGSIVAFFFSWNSLDRIRPKEASDDAEHNLATYLAIGEAVRHLFTALDALACCIFLAEDVMPQGTTRAHAEKWFRRLNIKTVGKEIADCSAYQPLGNLLSSSEFRYLSEYRNLLSHRPFPQFEIQSDGTFHLPESLGDLDSETQRQRSYQNTDAATFVRNGLNLSADTVALLLGELGARYSNRI